MKTARPIDFAHPAGFADLGISGSSETRDEIIVKHCDGN